MRYLPLILAIISSGVLQAQEPPPKVPTSFYCFRYAENLKDVFVPTGAAAYQKIELSTANMIGPVPVLAPEGSLTLHRRDTAEDGTEIYPLVGRAKLGSIRSPLVILLPGPKDGKLPYRTLVLDRDDAKFPLGSYQFINLSSHPMRGLIGKTRLEAKPFSVKSLRPKAAPGDMMTVIFEYNDGKHWRPMTKTRWAYRDDRRSLLCAYLDPSDQRVKMRSIPERLVPPKPTP